MLAGTVLSARYPARDFARPDKGQAPVAARECQRGDLIAQPPGANWTSYNGDYTGRRYSGLHEITPANVARLRAAWIFHPSNSSARSNTGGRQRRHVCHLRQRRVRARCANRPLVWHYERPVSAGLLDDAAGHKNRGVAVWENFVYMETDDAHLLCLDARTGHLLWDVTYADKAKHYGATSAPLL